MKCKHCNRWEMNVIVELFPPHAIRCVHCVEIVIESYDAMVLWAAQIAPLSVESPRPARDLVKVEEKK